MNEFNTIDRIAAYGGGGLVMLGVVVIGFIEIVGGSPHPVEQEGQIVHEALVPIEIRVSIILLGLVIWTVYAAYKLVGTTPAIPEQTADE